MEQHKILSDLIKNVHANLRKAYQRDNDFKAIWLRHCENIADLKTYAEAMKDLAINIWDKQRPDNTRIDWVHKACKDYFFEGGLDKLKQKDIRRKLYYGEIDMPTMDNQSSSSNLVLDKLRLLDVGSCYNPFSKFPIFETLALDLCPVEETIFKCDFLNIQIINDKSIIQDFNKFQDDITKLPAAYFHVIVFSLLLEYIPCPKMRLKCCELANNLLLPDGLLVIVTCDSHKQHRNVDMMKQWKRNIEKHSFQRNKYEKLDHLHCMTFRKIDKSNYYFQSNSLDRNRIKETDISDTRVRDCVLANMSSHNAGITSEDYFKSDMSKDESTYALNTDNNTIKLPLECSLVLPSITKNVTNIKSSESVKELPIRCEHSEHNSSILTDFGVGKMHVVESGDDPSRNKNSPHCDENDIIATNDASFSARSDDECKPPKCRKLDLSLNVGSAIDHLDQNINNKKTNLSKTSNDRKIRCYDIEDGLNIPQDF